MSFAQALEASFAKACARDDFRLVHYSIQRDHLHLIVEAEDNVALGNGMKSISARIAHSVKRVFQIPGKVLDGVYHARRLTSPRQVRNALRYVLLNARKHWQQQWGAAPPMQLDRASSARWFDGWSRALPTDRAGPRPVAEARSWLLCRGWRRHGLIDPSAVPGASEELVSPGDRTRSMPSGSPHSHSAPEVRQPRPIPQVASAWPARATGVPASSVPPSPASSRHRPRFVTPRASPSKADCSVLRGNHRRMFFHSRRVSCVGWLVS